jgi:hypothetical protein
MQTMEEKFGSLADPDVQAQMALASPQTGAAPAHATTDATMGPPPNALRALTDWQHSPIFWVAIAAVLGLAMVSGQLAVSARLRARGGR